MKMKLRALLVVVPLMALPGCSQDSDTPGHVHHEFPAHRPANFKAAVAALEWRSRGLARPGEDRNGEKFERFVDVIGWLPELAADSDLKKPEWESAKAAADHLQQLVAAKDLDLTQLESVISGDLKTLQALVPKAGRPEPDLTHHHHHDHDHAH